MGALLGGGASIGVGTGGYIVGQQVAAAAAAGQPSPWLIEPPLPAPPDPSTLSAPASALPANHSWDPGALQDTALSNRTEWDYLIFKGSDGTYQMTPGIATVKARKRARIDRKATGGNDGETATHLGMRCGEIEVRILLLTQTDFDLWLAIVKMLQSAPGKDKPDPIGVSHPGLAANGIASLYAEDIGIPQSTGPGGPLEVNLRFVEFLPQKKAPPKTLEKTKVRVDDRKPKQAPPAPPTKPSANASVLSP